jgi:hypothetical protein
MRSLLIITIGVILLGAYLEWTALQFQRADALYAVSPVASARVIRNEQPMPKPAKVNIVQKAATRATQLITAKIPLNLTVPSPGDAFNISFPAQNQSSSWLKKSNPKEEISYNAELIFDEKEGSSVTGGKVHIKIPFG